MATFRVPYPGDPERRRAIFEAAVAKLGRYGTCEGTPEAGTFHGSTPIGGFTGSFRSVGGMLEVEVTKKPFLVSTGLIESEVRKFLARA
jgi:hypothetical protein